MIWNVPMFDLAENRSRSTQVHHSNNLVLLEYSMLYTKFQGHRFWRKWILKGFTIYGHGGHLGPVLQLIYISLRSHSLIGFHMKFAFK